ncbi:DEAD-box type RNA helicase [Mortierella alpina]|nr:DEAD-box type RNA helicase [Mortierella alpina]
MPQPDDHALTSLPPQPTPLDQGPSAELIAQLRAVLAPCQQPEASPEAFHNLLNTSLASVLHNPGLHWWCNPDLRLTSVELLHLFSLDVENDNLKRFKTILENVLSTCIECTEFYLQDRQAYFAKLRESYDEDTVKLFFKKLLDWDAERLVARMETLMAAQASPETQTRKKICICEMLLDPTLLLRPTYSARISGPLTSMLSQMLIAKKMKLRSNLPGLWLLALHQDSNIQTWATNTLAIAATLDPVQKDRWTGWEQFPAIWAIVLGLANGSTDRVDTNVPLTDDPARIWKAARCMISCMDSEVICLFIKADAQAWKMLQSRLLKLIQETATPSAVFLELCRISFHLQGLIKKDFWTVDSKFCLSTLQEAEQIFRAVYHHPRIQDQVTTLVNKERSNAGDSVSQSLSRVYADYAAWTSNYVNSLSGVFPLQKVLITIADILLGVVADRMTLRLTGDIPTTSGDQDSQCVLLEFDLVLLSIVFQLFSNQKGDEIMPSIAKILTEHWTWLAPLCILGSDALLLSGQSNNAARRISVLGAETSKSGRKIASALLDKQVKTLWSNYATATSALKLSEPAKLEESGTVIWLRFAQATASFSSSSIRNRLDQSSQLQLMNWQSQTIDFFSMLALLPKLETRPRFSQDALQMCQKFNDEIDVVFRANAILLQGLASQGETWLKRLTESEDKVFLVKTLKLWCSPDLETRTQALYLMRLAWQEVSRPSCLRQAFETGGEQSIEELNNILADFRNRGSPGGATPPVLFQLLLDSVTTLFLNNSVDGEGGLYLQIFLGLTSSQEVERHLALIKNLWNSIWLSLKAAFEAGQSIWVNQQDRSETIRTMKIVADVGLLVIGKIRYFERLLEFEKQDLGPDAAEQDISDGFDGSSRSLAPSKETMPLDVMKEAVSSLAVWTFAQDTSLCSSAIELVSAILYLLADHSNFVSGKVNEYLTKIAENKFNVKSLLTAEQRETLWIALCRHDTTSAGPRQPPLFRDAAPSVARTIQGTIKPAAQSTKVAAPKPDPIEISDDDFDDIDESQLGEMEFEGDAAKEKQSHAPTQMPTAAGPSTGAPRSDFFHRVTHSNNPFQTTLNFGLSGPSGGIPAGGSSSSAGRRLPPTLARFNVNITSKPTIKATPVKRGNKLSMMRADHRRERQNIVDATKEARQASKQRPITRPTPANATVSLESDIESASASESDSDGGNNGFSSLIDAEEKWNNRNKPQEPRKTKLLELDQVVDRTKLVDTIATRRQKAIDDAQRQFRLTPSLAALHAQILKWDVSSSGDRPPNGKEYAAIPSKFNSVHEYIRAFEPLLVLECWQQLMGAREEANQSSDSVMASFVNRVSIDSYQDMHMKIPLDKASSIMVEDVVVISDPNVKDIFTATGNAMRPKPFFAKVMSITRAKGQCEVVFRTYLKIEEGSPLLAMRPQTSWSILKMINLTTTHREYAALIAMQYYELCDDVLNPPNIPPPKISLANVQRVMDIYKVNTPQAQAIVGAIERPKGFTLIQGPPGTGKTKTILGLVGALLADGARARAAPAVQASRNAERPLQTGTVSRILVCAPSNAAIDEIVKRLKGGIRNTTGEIFIPKVVRVGTLDTVNAEVKDVALDSLIAKELESASTSKEEFQSAAQSINSMLDKMKQLQQELEKARLELVQAKDTNDPMAISNAQSQIKAVNKSKWQLGQELDTARSNHAEHSQKKDQARKDARNKILNEADVICSTLSASGHDLLTSATFTFETVIIDEAAQSVEISSLIPLKYGCKRCILVGDPNQLPPTVISQLATKYAYNQSLFVRIQNLAPSSVHLLSIQYRMHPDISLFPSREFYKSLLKDGPDMDVKTKAEWHRNTITSPYRFFDVYEGRERIGLSHSQHNPIEAEAAVALLEGLCNGNPTLNFFRRVGVISPYKQQVRTLRECFQRTFDRGILEAVDFNTVDGFQGQEKDIIIFSCVRASQSGSVGFLADIRRMNVALTRARQSLFILGHADTLRREEIWGDLVRDAEQRGLFTKVTPGIFGPRGASMPRNILQAKSGPDLRNDLYGRTLGTKPATAIERPMATMDDIMEVDSYPQLPGSTPTNEVSLPLRHGGGHADQRKANGVSRGRGVESRRQDLALQALGASSGFKRKQDSSSDRPMTRSPVQASGETSNDTDKDPKVKESHDAQRPKHPLPARPPSPKRSKPSSSLFLKSKPMSMKKPMGPSRQYDIPVRERLAAEVIPIRKSYPSGSNRAQLPSPTARRSAAPSLDDILSSMKKP